MAASSSREVISPQMYQEKVKGLQVVEQDGDHSRTATPEDAKILSTFLHPAVRLILSNTKVLEWSDKRKKITEYLLQQARAFNENQTEIVQELSKDMDKIIDMGYIGPGLGTENMEIDLYVHGFSDEGMLPPVAPMSINTMGIDCSITPLNSGSPEMRPAISTEKPCKITPNAKENSNVINVGEVVAVEANLVKKVAQLERATTYAHMRATQANARDASMLEVVGYAALEMLDGSSMAAAMITLHPDWFPNLSLLHEKNSLAYMFSTRVFQDMSTLIDGCSRLSADMAECKKTIQECKKELKELRQQMDLQFAEMQKQLRRCNHALLFVGITVGALLWFRRF